MNRLELEQKISQVIHQVAPDVDVASLQPETRLREDLEIDSFDFLQVIIGLNQALGLEVPEADYAKLATFGSALDYLTQRLRPS